MQISTAFRQVDADGQPIKRTPEEVANILHLPVVRSDSELVQLYTHQQTAYASTASLASRLLPLQSQGSVQDGAKSHTAGS